MSRFTILGCKRLIAASGVVAALGLATLTGAGIAHGQEPAVTPAAHAAHRSRLSLLIAWSATSPATHLGDRYALVVENTGPTAQDVWVRALIMDHRAHTNTVVVDERVTLAPGEERELAAVNDYGTANHFSTRIGSETQDLALTVTITDAAGEETARFTEAAFWMREGAERFRPDPAALATSLGTTVDELAAAWTDGQSLAAIAEEHGKTRAELEAFLTDRFEDRLHLGIAAGAVAAEQAATWRERFATHLDRLIDRERGPHQHGMAEDAEATPAP